MRFATIEENTAVASSFRRKWDWYSYTLLDRPAIFVSRWMKSLWCT